MTEPTAKFKVLNELRIFTRWTAYLLAISMLYTLVRVQIFGKELVVYSLSLQNRPLLTEDQREELKAEAAVENMYAQQERRRK